MGEDRVDLRAVAWSALRHWPFVLVVTVLLAVGSYTYSARGPHVYRASTTLLVGDVLTAQHVTNDDLKASQSLAFTYADLARRQPVLDGVVRQLDLPMTWTGLRRQVSALPSATSPQLIVVSADASSPRLAERIAGAVSDRLLAFTRARSAGSASTAAFAREQVSELKADIERSESELASLQRQPPVAGESVATARAASALTALQRHILDLRNTYTQMAAIAPSGGPSSIEVLEAPRSSSAPIRPNPRFSGVAGGVTALVLSLAYATLRDSRRRRPALATGSWRIPLFGKVPLRRVSRASDVA
jgi:capsular polysaccharide biosynthesis protein